MDTPGIGRLHSRQDAAERGLARAVGTDQSDALATADPPGGLAKQGPPAEALGDGVERDHVGARPLPSRALAHDLDAARGDREDDAYLVRLSVGIGVHDGQGRGRPAPQVLVLDAALGRVDADVAAVPVEPDRSHLWRAVGIDGGEAGEGLLLEQVLEAGGNIGHVAGPFLVISSMTAKAWRTDFMLTVPPMMAPTSSVSAISAAVA